MVAALLTDPFAAQKQAVLDRYRNDRCAFLEEECQILVVPSGSHAGHMQKWKLYDEQLRYLDVFERQIARRGYVRIINPKARKRGSSSLTQGLGIHHNLFNDNSEFRTFAHDAPSTAALWKIGSRFLAHMDPVTRAALPMVVSDVREEMTFTNGAFRAAHTAGGTRRRGGKGRGWTPDFLHASEIPQWDVGAVSSSAADVASGVVNSVPKEAGVIVLEATCLGPYGMYYETTMSALAGKNDYEVLFFDARCYVRVEVDLKKRAAAEALDRQMKEARAANDDAIAVQAARRLGYSDLHMERACSLDLSPWHVAFWKNTLASPECNNDQDKYDHEYPYTLDLAFSGMGEQIFPIADVRARIAEVGRAIAADELKCREGTFVKHGDDEEWTARFVEGPGPWRLFEEPIAGHVYLQGGDLASGQQTKKHDNCSLSILNRVTKNQAAGFYGQYPPEEMAEQAALASRYFRTNDEDAIVAPEREDYGMAFLQEMRNNWPDIPIYHQVCPPDTDSAHRAHYAGWVNNHKTRTLLAALFRSDFIKGRLRINDTRLLEEMLSFVERAEPGKRPRPDHAPGKRSDFIFAHGITIVIDHELSEEGEPEYVRPTTRPGGNIDDELLLHPDEDEPVESYEVWF